MPWTRGAGPNRIAVGGGMLEARERVVQPRQGRAQGAQQRGGVGLNRGQTDALHPGEQADEVSRAVSGGDRSDLQARPGRHQAREFQAGVAGGKKLEQLVLQVENFQRLVAIGDLENEARAGSVAQEEILIALAGQRFGGERESIEIAGQADGVGGW